MTDLQTTSAAAVSARPAPERPVKLCKVFVSEHTRDALAVLASEINRGPGKAAAFIVEELAREGLLEMVWRAHRARYEAGKVVTE